MSTPPNSSRSTAPAHTASPIETLPSVSPDSLFFDPPTVNNSLAPGDGRGPSFLSFAGTDAEQSSARELSSGTAAAATSLHEGSGRRRQASRRATIGSSTTATTGGAASGTTPAARSLDQLAATMKSDLEGASAGSPAAPTVRMPTLTRAALDEHANTPSSSSFHDTSPVAHDGQPLLTALSSSAHATAAAAAAIARQSEEGEEALEFLSMTQRPSEDIEGSVHVATRPGRHRGTRDSSAVRAYSVDMQDGLELSLDKVTVQVQKTHRFRSRQVTYLDACSLHIAPGSRHCITSINPVYARTALAVLAGVVSASKLTGAPLANALPTTSIRYRRQVAYVASLDCCTEEATVYENLAFATRIRFDVDAATLHAMVEQAASDALLMEYVHARAADLSLARRYLLAIAMELLSDPTVLLLEDPLSFFSLSEMQLFTQLLHRLRRGCHTRTVVWTTSSIPWTLFDSIDSLTLLTTDGKTFYSGSKTNVEAFLQEDLGILRVPGEDVVDILAQTEIDAVAVAHATASFERSKYYHEVRQEVEAHRTRISTNSFIASSEPLNPVPSYASVQAALLVYVLRRNVLGRAALVPWIGLFAVMMVVCGLVALADREGYEEHTLQNMSGTLFLLLSCSVQINSVFFKTELRDWRTYLSFRNNLYFPATPYYVATIVRLLAPRLCFALAGSVCGALIFAQGTAAAVSAMMALLSFVHACLGLVAVYWLPRLEWLMVVNQLYYAYCVIFCGFLVSLSRVPTVVSALSLLRIAYGGLVAHEVSGLVIGCNATDSSASSSGSAAAARGMSCFRGEDYLALRGLEGDSLTTSFVALTVLAPVIMALLGLSLYVAPSVRLFAAS